MPDVPRTERRSVRSADPSLSPEANRLLTDELRAIVGSDEVEVPVDRADPAHATHGVHSPWVANIIDARLGPVFTGLAAICVAAVVALTWSSWVILVLALAILVAATLLALRSLLSLTDEVEHPDPETAALLEAEGVGDPDRVLEDLVHEFQPPVRDLPTTR
ncbi:MAG: hypothetical protein JWQ18_411 [Conexibacter sp.]|nr:hypothetical protein [Conexibacter sp.]